MSLAFVDPSNTCFMLIWEKRFSFVPAYFVRQYVELFNEHCYFSCMLTLMYICISVLQWRGGVILKSKYPWNYIYLIRKLYYPFLRGPPEYVTEKITLLVGTWINRSDPLHEISLNHNWDCMLPCVT